MNRGRQKTTQTEIEASARFIVSKTFAYTWINQNFASTLRRLYGLGNVEVAEAA